MKPNTSLMREAMIDIDAAINCLAMIHNRGIEQGATDKLKRIYDWLGATAQVLDDMDEQIGEQDG